MNSGARHELVRCPDDRWDELSRLDASATFYQTPQWYGIVAPYLHGTPHPLWFRFEDDGRTLDAALPLLRVRHFAFDFYVSPFGTYSGVLSEHALSPAQLQEIVDAVHGLNVWLVPSPFSANPLPLGVADTEDAFIQRIDLETLDADNVAAHWEEGERRRLRVAARKGVIVREATTREDLAAYYRVYESSLRRWGRRATSHYPFSLFERIWDALAGTDAMKLWLAIAEDEVAAGYLAFYHQGHTAPWHGATEERYFTYGVSQLCLRHMIEFAKENGYRYFDLTMSGGHHGVEDYKRRLGTERFEFTTLHHESRLYGALKSTYKLATHPSRLLPGASRPTRRP
jgi:CelD/BcsL family acetyltransferase involved in cellulose biosynthesis